MLKRFIIPLLLLATGYGVMQFLASFKKDQKRMPPRAVVRTVSAGKIHYGEVCPVIETMGRITPLEKVALTPEVSGIIQQYPFRLYEGAAFRKNDILYIIDSSQIFYSFRATISDLQNAVAGLIPEFAGNNTDAGKRWRDFFSHLSATSLPEPPATASDREKLLATRYSVYKLYFTAKQLQNTLEKHTIRAPFNGTVESTQVYPSSMARTGSAMASLVRTDALEIEVSVTLAQLPQINHGTKARVFMDDDLDNASEGAVHRISDIINEKMQTATVFVRLEKPRESMLRSGAFVRVHLNGSPLAHAFSIPRKAIHDERYVYTIEKDTLASRPVTIVYLSIDSAYCSEGIADGATVILEPVQDAVIGMAVQDESTAQARAKRAAAKDGPAGGKNAPGKNSVAPPQKKDDTKKPASRPQ